MLGPKNSKTGIKSHVTVSKNGELISEGSNLILDTGWDFICNAIGSTSNRPAIVSHIAVGTGGTAAVPGNTALEAEISRVALDYSHTTGENIFSVSAAFPPGVGTGFIRETGICNAAVDGIFLDRYVFEGTSKGPTDDLTFTYEFSFVELV